jgi:hypothetical protein
VNTTRTFISDRPIFSQKYDKKSVYDKVTIADFNKTFYPAVL